VAAALATPELTGAHIASSALQFQLSSATTPVFERLECEVLQKVRYINTLTFTFLPLLIP